ncbi:unnamed protein product [Amoebophrya sp. A25]|nr:unnamed protein product [Amoebophrya sp. A25]|eukprot:GSA25T00012692001.1
MQKLMVQHRAADGGSVTSSFLRSCRPSRSTARISTMICRYVVFHLGLCWSCQAAVRMRRIFPYDPDTPKKLDIDGIQASLGAAEGEKLDTAIEELARSIMATFFNGTGLRAVWDFDAAVGKRVPRFRYDEEESESLPFSSSITGDALTASTTSSMEQDALSPVDSTKAGINMQSAASASSAAAGSNKSEEGSTKSITDAVLGWFSTSTSAQEGNKASPRLDAEVDAASPRKNSTASNAQVVGLPTRDAGAEAALAARQGTSAPGIREDAASAAPKRKRYPKDYINFCILGLDTESVPLVARYIEFFPQFSFWIFDDNMDWTFYTNLVEFFPDRSINVEYDDRIEHLKPKCHITAFGTDSLDFTMARVGRELFTKTEEMLLVWQTHGCERSGALEWNPECAYFFQQWTSTMCGREEDLMLDEGQAKVLRESRYGPLQWEDAEPCVIGSRTQEKVNSWAVRNRIASGEDASDLLAAPEVALTANKPLCTCLVDRSWISDLHYEKPICHEFETRVLPPGKRIYARHTENWYDPLKDFFFGYGQWNQDWFLYNNLFRGRRKGFFVDIGAMAPFELSNTAVFEQCFDWEGLCVEPNPSQHLIMLGYRPNCRLVPYCLGRKSGAVKTFGIREGSTGHSREASDAPVSGAEEDDEAKKKLDEWLPSTELLDTFQSDCITMDEMLRFSGIKKETPIDFVSIDIEGGELEVLVDFPFEKYTIHAFLIEAGHDTTNRVDILLLGAGYVKMALIGKDHVYVHGEYLQLLAGNYLVGETDMNPFDLVYPPYINIEPYNDTFPVFQRRFLDPKFGE